MTALLAMLGGLLAFPPNGRAAKPRYGFYTASQVRTLGLDAKTGKPLPSELSKVARHNFLYTDSRGQVTEWKARHHSRPTRNVWIYSVDNANQDYRLTAILPKLTSRAYAIHMGHPDFIVSTGSGNDGRTYTYTFRLTRKQADRAAVVFGVPRKDRPNLGKSLKVDFTVVGDKAGAPVTVKATITNIGSRPLVAPTGGAYRGSGRNNRFSFKATLDKQPLEDIGRSMHFGGLGGIPELAPGQSHTVQAVLTKWFKLDRPGSYELTATYDLQAQLPRPRATTRAPWPSYAHQMWQAPRTATLKFQLKP